MPKMKAVVVLASALLLSCGSDAPAEPESPVPEDCARMEVTTFEQCTEFSVNYRSPESLEAWCDSRCDKVQGAVGSWVYGVTEPRELRGLVEANGINFDDMHDMESLQGLEDLEVVNKTLYLRQNPKLENLHALRSLRRVGTEDVGQLDIVDNDSLETLQGLESLQEARVVVIEANDRLRSIEALENLQRIQTLHVTGNPNLPRCQIERLVEQLQPDYVRIRGNGTGSCE